MSLALFNKHGYTIVNDYELPDDDLGFDITGNEVMQPPNILQAIWEILKNT